MAKLKGTVTSTVIKTRHIMAGGPYGGKALYLETPGTLPFSCNGFNGRYDSQNRWVGTVPPVVKPPQHEPIVGDE